MTLYDHYAVFGHPIGHSKSPLIHRLFAEQTQQKLSYEAQDVSAKFFDFAVDGFIKQGGKGINCTVPLKELAWKRADTLSVQAQLSKAVNTLVVLEDGALMGDNTDGIGLIRDLTINHSITLENSRILILGAGGACRGIIGPLMEKLPSQIIVANRTVKKAIQISNEFSQMGEISACGYDDLKKRQFDLVINATSTSLTNELPPLDDSILAENACCYDLAYSNQPTTFVCWGLMHDAEKSLDGLGMLVEQAAEAFCIWRGVRPETSKIIERLNSERS